MGAEYRLKKCGILGIDRSGSRGNYPIAVASVYSENMKNFEKAIQEIKTSFKIRHGRIKGKDFSFKQHENAVDIIISNNIRFFVCMVSQKDYSEIEKFINSKKSWEQNLEALLWFKSVYFLAKKFSLTPKEVFYERTFPDTVFDKRLESLIKEKLFADSVCAGDKFSPYIVVADWIANFFFRNSDIANIYRNQILYIGLNTIEQELRRLFKL
ncbi:MAG: hypothetical protein WA139_04660 [Candidatus Aenigmatarchaeota archaeon]